MIAELPLQQEAGSDLSAALLSSAASQELVQMIARVSPSVVQVHKDQRGGGAGVIWRSDGAILTNHHVIAGGGAGIHVLFPDGRDLPAKLINQSSTLDLALLQVDAQDLPAALVDDSSKLRIGEMVFAYGHPWGQKNVVTAGIVSGNGTVSTPDGSRSAQYVRSDVQVAPGNSGGPLLNARGAVVGITAMIFGGDLTVAIPSHVANEWVAGLPSRRVYLGVAIRPVDVPIALPQSVGGGTGAYTAAGLLVVDVEPNGPANRAGMRAGDVLLAANGKPVIDGDTLLDALSQGAAQDHVQLHLLRGGAIQDLDIELA